jgi:hypothetical protein
MKYSTSTPSGSPSLGGEGENLGGTPKPPSKGLRPSELPFSIPCIPHSWGNLDVGGHPQAPVRRNPAPLFNPLYPSPSSEGLGYSPNPPVLLRRTALFFKPLLVVSTKGCDEIASLRLWRTHNDTKTLL